MIDLTVKTLDSQNHVFSLEDDVSSILPITYYHLFKIDIVILFGLLW